VASTDITPVVARLVNRVESVADIGLVYPFDIYSRDDLAPLVVSTINGVATLRAWWVTGPTMDGVRTVQAPGGAIERTWTYSIHGIVGLTDSGDHIETLRSLALAVTDALDLDMSLGSTCHRTSPCKWRTGPENRTVIASVGVAYVQIDKPVVTLSTP
jgi:hypothetical protein